MAGRRCDAKLLTHGDRDDGEKDECISGKEALDVVLGDVLHSLLGPVGPVLYSLPQQLKAVPWNLVLPVALCHVDKNL